MGRRLNERRLTQVSARVRELRDELAMIDEQLSQVSDEADDLRLRAMVAETPQAGYESNQARKHVEAMTRHRSHVVDEIAKLDARRDELLDRLTDGAANDLDAQAERLLR